MLMECDTGAPRSLFRTFEFHGCRSKQCGPLVMESCWYDLENSSVEDIPAHELGRIGDVVRKANLGVSQHRIRATVLIAVAQTTF